MASFLKLSVHLPHLDGSWQKKIIHLLKQTAISGIKDGRKDHCHPRWRSTNEVGEIRGLRLLGRLMQICLELCMGRISSSKFVPFGWTSCSRRMYLNVGMESSGFGDAIIPCWWAIISYCWVIWDFGRNLRRQVVDLMLIKQGEHSLNIPVSTATFCNPIPFITQHWYPAQLKHRWKCRAVCLSTTHMISTLLMPTSSLWPEEDILQRLAHIGVCLQPPRHSSAICFHFPNRLHFYRIHLQRVTPTSHVSPFLKRGRCSQSY